MIVRVIILFGGFGGFFKISHSHAGLALLLMVTMYPILVRSGVSKLSALSVIAICQYIDHGPGSGN
ncbi:C4-dicarboxylate ABC transporter, partial [Campylobacter jejuni]